MKRNKFNKAVLKSKLKDLALRPYILKTDIFEGEYDLLLNSFQKYYDDINIAYSFKTNYIPNFLNIVKEKRVMRKLFQ